MLLPPICARKKVSGKCRPATMPELRNFAFDSRVATLVADTMTSPGFLFKNIRASSCRIYIWNLAFSSFSWQLVSSLRDRPCMGLARLASHVLRETFFFSGDLSFGFGRVHVFLAKNAYPATRCLQIALRIGVLANPSETVLKVRATK